MAETAKRAEGPARIAVNRRAYFNYEVEDKIECGIALEGTEIKSVRDGRVAFPDAWVEARGGELWLRSFTIAENPFSSIFNHDPARPKKLLLHKREIERLSRRVEEKGYTLVPLSFYFKGRRVKVELGVCRGKKLHDKRAGIREREARRETERAFKGARLKS